MIPLPGPTHILDVAQPVAGVHPRRVGCSYFCDSVSVKPPERGVHDVVPPFVTPGHPAQLLRARDHEELPLTYDRVLIPRGQDEVEPAVPVRR